MELLKQLYKIHSKSGEEKVMTNFVAKCCVNIGAEVKIDAEGNLYAKKGESETYPCVVAHLDQVQNSHSADFRALVIGDVVFGFSESSRSQEGLGADDKNGIWVALRCLRDFDAIKVAFFVGEEVGCVGSGKADMSFFDDCRFVLQCDRRGSSDLITSVCSTELCSSEFLEAVGMSNFGYKKSSGLLTDVYTLKTKGLAVSCCNISCGYYQAHTDSEVTVISELQNCLNFVRSIIVNCVEVYPHEYVAPKWESYYDDFYGYPYGCYGGYGKGYGKSYGRGYGNYGKRSYYNGTTGKSGVITFDSNGETTKKEVEKKSNKGLLSIKDEEDMVIDDISNEVYELLYGEPTMSFKEYWDSYGPLHDLSKKKTRKVFNATKKLFFEENKECLVS